jgi:DNA helicase-2/ATP-dependent DNA helicase PcrA
MFSGYLQEDLLHGGIKDSRAMRNLAILSQLLGKFEYLHNISVLSPDYLTKNIRDLFNQFFRFLKDGGIDEYEDQQEYAPSGCVSFFTIHQSKGLEFPVVIVGSLEATPRKQYSDLDEILEHGYLTRPPYEPLEQTKYFDFRRLYYTAFSRAQNLLVLACQEKQGHGQAPSKYFAEHFHGIPSWRSPSFHLQDVPLADIKEVNLKHEYSFTSHLTLYENCSEQYRFFRELEFAPVRTNPILFGTLVHETIEDIHKTVLRGEERILSEEQVAAWFDTNYIYLTKRERVYLIPYVKSIALDQVLRYYRRNEGDWSRIKDAEVDVSLVKDEYILRGTIDLIVGENNTVELVDFKSEKKPDVNTSDDWVKLDRYRRQLEVYAHIVQERTGLEVSKTHLYYTSEEAGNPYITFDKDTRSIEKTIQSFDAVVHRIEARDFGIPARPVKLCSDCDMRHYCDTKNWKFRSKS